MKIILCLNVKCDSIFYLIYVYYWRIISHCFMFFNDILKKNWISDAEYDPVGNSNFSLHIDPDILSLMLLFDFLYIFLCSIYAKIGLSNIFFTPF